MLAVTRHGDPTVARIDAYLAGVADVARRFGRLPADVVLRALRHELAELEPFDAPLRELAERISRGEFTAS